jgi:hypothetical protein
MKTSRELRELLSKVRSLETPNCLTPNEAERVIRGIIPDEIKIHLKECGICQALIEAIK